MVNSSAMYIDSNDNREWCEGKQLHTLPHPVLLIVPISVHRNAMRSSHGVVERESSTWAWRKRWVHTGGVGIVKGELVSEEKEESLGC